MCQFRGGASQTNVCVGVFVRVLVVIHVVLPPHTLRIVYMCGIHQNPSQHHRYPFLLHIVVDHQQ